MLIGGQQSDLQRYVNSRVEDSRHARVRRLVLVRRVWHGQRVHWVDGGHGLDDRDPGRRLDGGFDRIPGFIAPALRVRRPAPRARRPARVDGGSMSGGSSTGSMSGMGGAQALRVTSVRQVAGSCSAATSTTRSSFPCAAGNRSAGVFPPTGSDSSLPRETLTVVRVCVYSSCAGSSLGTSRWMMASATRYANAAIRKTGT